jgi:DNA-binding NarL/FixJ family response regulator
MKRPRLLLADDHRLVLEGLQKLLEPEFEVAGMVEDGRSLLVAAERLRPDVLLLDISMPLLNGIDAARRIGRSCPGTRVIFVSMHAEPAYVRAAFRAGGSGYVLKHCAAKDLVTAIREVLAGRSYVTPGISGETGSLPQRSACRPGSAAAALTPRQREVLQLVAEGRSNKEIAALLDISVKAVEFHKSAIARRLGTTRTSDLTKSAIALGLVAP